MNKNFSMKTQMFWGRVAPGCLWLLYAVVGIIKPDIVVLPFIAIGAAILIGVVFTVYRGEREDEMAKENYMKARAYTTRAMYYVFCISAILSAIVFGLLKDCELNWPNIISKLFFVMMGVQDILSGVFFFKLEAE